MRYRLAGNHARPRQPREPVARRAAYDTQYQLANCIVSRTSNTVGIANSSPGVFELMCQPSSNFAVTVPSTSSPVRFWIEP